MDYRLSLSCFILASCIASDIMLKSSRISIYNNIVLLLLVEIVVCHCVLGRNLDEPNLMVTYVSS